jgi:hypothetical protein
MVHASVPLPRYVALRHSFRISHLLWTRCLPRLCIYGPHFELVSPPRSGVCRRPDVGLRNIRVSDPGSCNHRADPLARRCSERSARRLVRISSTETEWLRSGGRLKTWQATPSLIIATRPRLAHAGGASGRNPLRRGRLLDTHQAGGEFVAE